MLKPEQTLALVRFYKAAKESGHLFPEVAACEAVVETTWGTSKLYLQANNVFGTKQHTHPAFETVNFPTREYLGGRWTVVNAPFIKYPTVQDSFKDRMDTLQRLAPHYEHYAAALEAKTPEEFVTEVSRTWSTSPSRAATCIQIMHAHPELLKS